MLRSLRPVCIACAALLLAGCASYSGNSYNATEARQMQTVQMGIIEAVRPVRIEGTNTGLGTIGGGVAGGIAGGTIGGGSGSTLAALGGALLGAAAGTYAEDRATRADAYEMVVRLDSGTSISLVQTLDRGEPAFEVGQKVRVHTSRENSRVSRSWN